jgi:hypothetical protein
VTHDELLAKLSNDENGYAGSTPLQRVRALRAVVELCDKWETKGSYCLPIDSVIQAIEKELG